MKKFSLLIELRPRICSYASGFVIGGLVVGLLGSIPIAARAQQKSAAETRTQSESGEIARGKYIVEGVAMCGQCHTPRDSSGALDQAHALEGAPVFMRSASQDADWPLTAPRIGGTPPASDADMVKLLTTGIWTTGKPLRFPMMPFRMSQSDAEAVIAYLRSMHSQP